LTGRLRGLLFGLACLAAVGTEVCAAAAPCATLSGATVRLIVPNSPGGGYDAYARLLQPYLAKTLGATIVVENRSGAGGLVGAAAIRDATPNGKTLGIINASGLLAAGLDQKAPHPADDFTVIARLLSNHTVLITGRDSGIRTLDDLLRLSTQRPIVIGVRDTGSASLFVVPVVASLLGIRYELVTGYDGNAARSLAAMRGEVDLLMQNFDSVQRFIADGELQPLLQLGDPGSGGKPGPNQALLSGVPILDGETGVAKQRARYTGRTPDQAMQEARLLIALINAGRLLVAPPGLPENHRRCLETAAGNALASKEFKAAAARAKLSIEPASAEEARADIAAASKAVTQFAPLVQAAMRQARQ
jgi:tripartite-type tricarboxylate transporter receptor subunit TctC